jgi:hypothetical protein
MDIVVQVTGIEELIKKVNDPALLGEPLRGFFNNSTKQIQRNVQQTTPIDTGNLYASWGTKVDISTIPQWGIMGTITNYARYVEYGTKPHWIGRDTKAGQAIALWAHSHGINPFLVRRKIARYGTKGKFMLRDGVQRSLADIKGFLANAASEIENRWGRK